MPRPRPANARTAEQKRRDEHDRAARVLEDAAFLASTGVAIYDAAPRLGFTSDRALDKYLRRWKRPDLVVALTANNVPGIEPGRRKARHHHETQEARAS